MFRIIETNERGVHLSLSNGQILISRHGEETKSFPVAQCDAVIIAQNAMTLTGAAIASLGEAGVPIIFCGRNYSPVSVLKPLFSRLRMDAQLLHMQTTASKALVGQMWQRLIQTKIRGQNHVLKKYRDATDLDHAANGVLSGDSGNVEARAAAVYWRRLGLFKSRERNADDANCLFNYLYTVLFAATARYVCAAGLEPQIGIWHHCSENHFCLASDLMEPYRPYADSCILDFMEQEGFSGTLSRDTRTSLIVRFYSGRVTIHGEKLSVFDALQKTILSFRSALLENKSNKIILPSWKGK